MDGSFLLAAFISLIATQVCWFWVFEFKKKFEVLDQKSKEGSYVYGWEISGSKDCAITWCLIWLGLMLFWGAGVIFQPEFYNEGRGDMVIPALLMIFGAMNLVAILITYADGDTYIRFRIKERFSNNFNINLENPYTYLRRQVEKLLFK
ncbi:hypothetical protein [Pseudoalteromonas phage J2-1_QLiu-2017]|nr:hypothetical protein [Pseudoalteromonas phage J2-1_QLiu-2017]